MVVPPGEQTISFSAPGCSPVPAPFLRNPLLPERQIYTPGAWHPAQHGGVGHRFDKHKYVAGEEPLTPTTGWIIGSAITSLRQSSGKYSAHQRYLLGLPRVWRYGGHPGINQRGSVRHGRIIFRSWPSARASWSSVTPEQ